MAIKEPQGPSCGDPTTRAFIPGSAIIALVHRLMALGLRVQDLPNNLAGSRQNSDLGIWRYNLGRLCCVLLCAHLASLLVCLRRSCHAQGLPLLECPCLSLC